jgi:hypothetical protein
MERAMARVARIRSKVFSWEAFAGTVAALLIAPVLADVNILHSYTPFLLLRGWMIGFSCYGIVLSLGAAGFRRHWRLPYGLMAAIFLFVWGIPADGWLVVDWSAAVIVAVSALFLRTWPAVASSAPPVAGTDLRSAA